MDLPNRRMYYVVNARMPNKKAYGIQIAKMCEAFVEDGVDLQLIVPKTRASRSESLRSFYNLRVDVPTKALPCVDWYARGRLGFALSSAVFMITCSIFLFAQRLRGRSAMVYTIDMDSFSFTLLPLIGFPVVTEIHTPKKSSLLLNYFMIRARCIIPTNTEIKKQLKVDFDIDDDRLLVEPNGVDLQLYQHMPTKSEAREHVGIPQEGIVALYVGRFYEWKGLGILIKAADRAKSIMWYVLGGSPQEFQRATGISQFPENLIIAGEVSQGKIPVWLAAADTLLILGTKENEESYRFTAPMKVFEYMAAQRPVVASGTPALRSLIPPECAFFYEPDDPLTLVEVVEQVVKEDVNEVLASSNHLLQEHSWKSRAKRICTALTAL